MKKIHITDVNGKKLFNRLFDNGTLTLNFESGFGFVDLLDIKRNGWVIVEGWWNEKESGPKGPMLTQ